MMRKGGDRVRVTWLQGKTASFPSWKRRECREDKQKARVLAPDDEAVSGYILTRIYSSPRPNSTVCFRVWACPFLG